MSFDTPNPTRELSYLLLAFLAFVQVILYVDEWPFATRRAELWVLHLVDGLVVGGGGKKNGTCIKGAGRKPLGVCVWERVASTNQNSPLSWDNDTVMGNVRESETSGEGVSGEMDDREYE